MPVLNRQNSPNWGYRLLLVFGLMQFVSLGRALFIEYLGGWVNELAATLNGVSVAFLCAAVFWYVRNFGNPLHGAAKMWMIVVSVLTAIATARGLLAGLVVKYVVLDLLAFISLLCLVLVGSIPQAFDDLRRVWFRILVLAIPLNLLALTDLGEFSRELTTGVRVARETISYRTHNTLDVVLLVGAFAFRLKRWQRLVVLTGLCQVILMQVIYQKRLESFFFGAIAATCAMVWWTDNGAWRQQLRRYIWEGLAACVILVGLAFVTQRPVLVAQAIALYERATGRSQDIDFGGGTASYFFLNNERMQIVSESLETLSPTEIAFGRGMGGGAEWASFNVRVLDSSQSEDIWASFYLPDYGFFGRRAFEIGAATPILKGGVVYWIAIYSVYALFLFRVRQVGQSLAGRLCIVLVAFQLPYTFFGGDFNVSSIFQMGNYAACLGMGLAVYGRPDATVGRNLTLYRERWHPVRGRPQS